jgi:tRNA A37 N6-isopentenylltransferase MiaA
MMKPSGHICALLIVFGAVVLAQSDSAAIGKAEALLKNLQDGKFAEVVAQFDPVMAKAIPEERLRTVWQSLTEQFGAVKSIDERRSGELKGYRAVELILAFEREQVVQRMVLDGEGRIAGLAYQPASMAALPAAK